MYPHYASYSAYSQPAPNASSATAAAGASSAIDTNQTRYPPSPHYSPTLPQSYSYSIPPTTSAVPQSAYSYSIPPTSSAVPQSAYSYSIPPTSSGSFHIAQQQQQQQYAMPGYQSWSHVPSQPTTVGSQQSQPKNGSTPSNRYTWVFGQPTAQYDQQPSQQHTPAQYNRQSYSESADASRLKPARTTVYLNVYHLDEPKRGFNRLANSVGCGFFHSGIEVYGKEYSFGGPPQDNTNTGNTTGVFAIAPGTALPLLYKHIELGEINMSKNDVLRFVEQFKQTWRMSDYDLLHRNCNDFSRAFAKALNPSFSVPSWVNRAAKVGQAIPNSVIQRVLRSEGVRG